MPSLCRRHGLYFSHSTCSWLSQHFPSFSQIQLFSELDLIYDIDIASRSQTIINCIEFCESFLNSIFWEQKKKLIFYIFLLLMEITFLLFENNKNFAMSDLFLVVYCNIFERCFQLPIPSRAITNYDDKETTMKTTCHSSMSLSVKR